MPARIQTSDSARRQRSESRQSGRVLKTKATPAEKRRPRTLTHKRKQMVADFMYKFITRGATKYGRYGSDRWVQSLIEFMRKQERFELIPDDVKSWLAAESYFEPLNIKYKFDVSSELSLMAVSPSSSSSDSCAIIEEVRNGNNASRNVTVSNQPVAGPSGTGRGNKQPSGPLSKALRSRLMDEARNNLENCRVVINAMAKEQEDSLINKYKQQKQRLRPSGSNSELPQRTTSRPRDIHANPVNQNQRFRQIAMMTASKFPTFNPDVPARITTAATSGTVPRATRERRLPANDPPNILEEWHHSATRLYNAVLREQNLGHNTRVSDFHLDSILRVADLLRHFVTRALNN